MVSDIVISVLLTAHNCEKFLSATLASLKDACNGVQDSIEIILINDASTDNTQKILHDFAAICPHAKTFDVTFRNIGKVRNYGVSKCKGKYITMLDGDDQLLKNSLSEVTHFLQKENPDLLVAPLNEVFPHQNRTKTWGGLNTQKLTQHQIIKKFLIHKDLQAHFIGQFIRADLLKDKPFPEFTCYEDAYLFPSILKDSKNIFFANQSPYLYFKREKSLSNKLDEHKISLLIKATQRMDEVLGDKYRNLLTCHWINIAHKFNGLIHNEHDKHLVYSAILKASLLSFTLDSTVRTSFKKKFLKLKLKRW